MTDQFEVRPQELVTHAGHVEAIAGRVTTAAEAGAAVRPGVDAYGKLCVMVPVMLGALQDVVVDGIGAAAVALEDTGARLRATAESYAAIDESRRQRLLEIQDGKEK
ncbi:type VII secretion target [Actinoplanes sp. NPDC048967]|uniref:type VII secretion target n=1 Tax=Actinoplanes sp. NPDC048967 TaxID=3155269 RepID=UPI0033F79AC4